MKKQGSGVRDQGPEKPRKPGVISAQTVRAALAQGEAGLGELCARLDIPEADSKGRDEVRKILRDLENFYQIKVLGFEGEWVYRLCDKPGARGAVQARLWRFACHRLATARPFTAAEAAAVAECDRDYAKRYCRWLWGAGYLQIVTRGRAGAWLYQVVGGKERESAPPWNRRAEKRKNVGQASSPAVHPASGQKEIPPSPPFPKGGDKDHRLEACATKLDAALGELRRTIVEVAGGCERAVEIVREMNETLQAVKEQGHDEPVEPTEGHHQP